VVHSVYLDHFSCSSSRFASNVRHFKIPHNWYNVSRNSFEENIEATISRHKRITLPLCERSPWYYEHFYCCNVLAGIRAELFEKCSGHRWSKQQKTTSPNVLVQTFTIASSKSDIIRAGGEYWLPQSRTEFRTASTLLYSLTMRTPTEKLTLFVQFH